MSDADAMIAALRAGHDRLAEQVATMTEADLAAPSGSSDWDVAQVLSHLGSGAEIGLRPVRSALGEGQPLSREEMLAIWDRWNAMTHAEQAAGFLRSNAELTAAYEALDATARDSLRIDLGFLPAPVDVATAASMRLSELTLHAWDVAVAFDPSATLPDDAATALLPRPGMLIGWLAKAEPLEGRDVDIALVTTSPPSEWTLHLGEQSSLVPGTPAQADATLSLPTESWLRLVAGRLAPEHTPTDVTVTGAVDLPLLREVFAGF